MNNKKLTCPKGTRDLHEKELYKIDIIENKIFEILRLNGYQRIDTPTFEHTDTFKKSGSFTPDKSYIFSDKSGRELTLRTDINAPVSRSIINNPTIYTLPAKLFFCDKVFRYRKSKKREFRMCGIELYGVEDFQAELDIFLSLQKIIKVVGFSDYRVEFNNLKLIKKTLLIIFKNNGIDTTKIDQYIYRLRYGNSEEILGELDINTQDINIISSILNNKGDSLDLLEKVCILYPELEDIKKEIMSFYDLMKQYGINCIFKISELHGTGFYSGLTYKIFVDDITDELGDGGRYDNMTESLGGKKIPATGIGFGVERLIRFMDTKKHNELFLGKKKVLLYTKNDKIKQDIYKILSQTNITDTTIEVELQNKKISDSIKYAKNKDYTHFVIVNEDTYKIIDITKDTSSIINYAGFNILNILNSLE